MNAAPALTPLIGAATPKPTLTLLDLVSALSDTGASDQEVVAAVIDLLATGAVSLVGQICEEHLLAH